jgi:hypothetical protein
MEWKIDKLTCGPKHHFFGFHDLVITNYKNDKYLFLETDIINRPPLPGEDFGFGYINSAGEKSILGKTCAVNYPQGARQQWLGDSEFCTVNNRNGNQWGADIYDTSANKLVDKLCCPIHVADKYGQFAFGLDYSRLHRLGGYGYPGFIDEFSKDNIPDNVGITKTNLSNGTSELFISVREVAEFGNKKILNEKHPHYITHLVLSPSSRRLAFLHRYFLADGGLMTRLFTVGIDNRDLRCLASGYLSHFNWLDDNSIYIFGRVDSRIDQFRSNVILQNFLIKETLKQTKGILRKIAQFVNYTGVSSFEKSFHLVFDDESTLAKTFADKVITEDGHPMTNPIFNNWISGDTYPDPSNERLLYLYNVNMQKRYDMGFYDAGKEKVDMSKKNIFFQGVDTNVINSVSAEKLAFTRSGLHCDLHPRWSSSGTELLFDSIHEGDRQIYKIQLQGLF